ncbi:hypothetical protein SISNIDRAFT_489596 [Sistotremastrum niveocremeum HHB9708]|uniref:Uncharacterized protein n=1 Tax=Sistotremastrum niveocremeum HHB9708 TaxID=1314777 RepID=A0A164PQ67_9AGAM|nr:hypothetical protein SISNIDRAFT_489596 [Sistotremastrum niveocremeum HHB9708]
MTWRHPAGTVTSSEDISTRPTAHTRPFLLPFHRPFDIFLLPLALLDRVFLSEVFAPDIPRDIPLIQYVALFLSFLLTHVAAALNGHTPRPPTQDDDRPSDSKTPSSLPPSPSHSSSPLTETHSSQSVAVSAPVEMNATLDEQDEDAGMIAGPSAIPLTYLPPSHSAPVASTSDPVFDIAPTLEKGNTHTDA